MTDSDNKEVKSGAKRRPPAAGMGRKKGVPNKATANARAAIGMFVENNAGRLQEWLDLIAEKDPEKAFTLFQSVIEYHVPKLARRDLIVDHVKPMQLVLNGSDVNG